MLNLKAVTYEIDPLCLYLAIGVGCTASARRARSKAGPSPTGPVPAAIPQANSIFVSKAGSTEAYFQESSLSATKLPIYGDEGRAQSKAAGEGPQKPKPAKRAGQA